MHYRKYIGFKEVKGYSDSGINELIDEIKHYNKRNLLILLMQVSMYVDLEGVSPDFTKRSIKSFFASDSALYTQVIVAYEIAVSLNPALQIIVIYRRSVLFLIRLVVENCPYDGGTFFDKTFLSKAGIWLLKINDYFGDDERKLRDSLYLSAPHATKKTKLERLHFSIRQHYFEQFGLQRSFEQFFRNTSIFRIIQDKYETNLDELLKARYHTTLTEYLDLTFLIFHKWNNLYKDYDALQNLKLLPEETFPFINSKSIKLYRSLLSTNFLSLERYINSSYVQNITPISSTNETYNFIPFVMRPLISFESDKSIACMSSSFLATACVENVFHLLKQELNNVHPSDKSTLSRIWGNAFQDYCSTILRKIFGTKFISESKYRKDFKIPAHKPAFDGVLLTRRFLFLFEIKGRRLDEQFILSKSEKATKEFLEDYFTKGGIGQIYSNLDQLKATNLLKKRKIIPVLLTFESIPNDFAVRDFIEQKLNNNRDITYDLLPYILLDARDIELLLALWLNNKDSRIIEDLLADFSSNHEDYELNPNTIEPFANYLRSKQLLNGNGLLAQRIEEYAAEIEERMQMLQQSID